MKVLNREIKKNCVYSPLMRNVILIESCDGMKDFLRQ